MPQVRLRDLLPLAPRAPHRRRDRAERAAPTEHEQARVFVGIVDRELGNVRRDSLDLLGAHVRLLLVVVRRVRDVAGQRVLLDAADPVLEARRAGITHARASVLGSRSYTK